MTVSAKVDTRYKAVEHAKESPWESSRPSPMAPVSCVLEKNMLNCPMFAEVANLKASV
jgi:hypothetical protein